LLGSLIRSNYYSNVIVSTCRHLRLDWQLTHTHASTLPDVAPPNDDQDAIRRRSHERAGSTCP